MENNLIVSSINALMLTLIMMSNKDKDSAWRIPKWFGTYLLLGIVGRVAGFFVDKWIK